MDDQKNQQAHHGHADNSQAGHTPVGHAPVINIKNEPISDGIEFENNPWNVESLQAFLCLKCPQCVFDTKEKDSFQNHAIENHPLSIVLFGRTLKEELNLENQFLLNKNNSDDPLEYEPDYLDYCESKLEEFDCEYTECNDHTNKIKQERKHKMPHHGVLEDAHKKHTEQTIARCSICEKDLKNKLQLKKHLRMVHKKKGHLECPICKQVLESTPLKMEHIAVKHPERIIYNCQYCDFKCLKSTSLKKHESQKHPEHNLPLLQGTNNKLRSCRVCPVCTKEFQTKIIMLEHYISNHPDAKVYSCPFCDAKYLKRLGFEKHISKVHPEHDSDISHTSIKGSHRTCPICKIVFKTRGLMMNHLTIVHPQQKIQKIYSCSLCNDKFRTFNGLQIHVFHCHERKVTDLGCSFCAKEFPSKMDLKSHIAIEHKEKKYECSKCDASYLHQRTLMFHIEQVHEEKKHQCTTCGEIFESIGRLETHIAVKHDRSKLFECPSCKAAYTIYQKLEEHIAFVHEKVSGHLCTQCGKNFKIKSSLRDHILVVHEGKKYHCDLCTKTFMNKSTLQSHVIQIHEGKKAPPVKCSQCQKSFSGSSRNSNLQRHISEVHEGKRPYACHLCGLTFGQSGNLKTHMKGKHKDVI